MNTTFTTRMTALTVAVLLTVVTNGSMLLSFDAVAHETSNAHNAHLAQSPNLVKLDTVTIVAKARA